MILHKVLALVLFSGFAIGAPTIDEGVRAGSRATGYVNYMPSSGLNVILSAPHGGDQKPSEIPDRDAGCWDGTQCIWSHTCGEKDTNNCAATTVKDLNTVELATELRQALCDRFGGQCPAAVINLLHRVKLDANRPVDEATFGEPLAVEAYNEYHGYITAERSAMAIPALYIDLHGHGHSIQRAELGYLVSGSDLDSGDPIDPTTTSIRSLASIVGGDFDELLRGQRSFGAMLEAAGFRAVPSPADPGPDGNSYFSGGYSTEVHGSRDGGTVDGIQIESPSSFRESPTRTSYVAALVETIANYLATNYP